jgi:hypothetical protein
MVSMTLSKYRERVFADRHCVFELILRLIQRHSLRDHSVELNNRPIL